MIKYEWRNQLSKEESAQLADLLHRAAEYDAEPEYSTIDFAEVQQAMAAADSRYRHLVVWMLPYATEMGAAEQPERIAGLIRLALNGDGTAEGTGVIDPRLRSIGIMTLLFERVGLNTAAPEGWLGTGAHTVTVWARGNHPASGRLSSRFLVPRTRCVWKLIRSTDSFEETAAAPVLEPASTESLDELGWASTVSAAAGASHILRDQRRVIGAVSIDFTPLSSEEFGSCATVRAVATAPTHTDAHTRKQLLNGAAALAHESGLTGLIIHVDSTDSALVNACRLVDFQHDRTDVLLQLGGE